ncbi:MAG: hypothetical protein ACYC4K_02845 [Thiobacillus sp.]
MRYYYLQILTPVTAPSAAPASATVNGSLSIDVATPRNARIVKEWTTHPKGVYDPGAQNIMFDMLITPYSTPTGGQTITIEGVSLNDLQNSVEFTGLQLQLSAGMKKGLPLANPAQSGFIAVGNIFQSFGNWEGTEMTLNFVVYPSSLENNLFLFWEAGTSLASSLLDSLNTAFPLIKKNINISGNLVQSHNEYGAYASLDGFAQAVSGITAALGHEVYITFQNGVINVFDDTYQPPPIQLNFTDMIGQPTWIEPNIVQVKLVMRADISVGATVLMPVGMQSVPGQVMTIGNSLPSGLKYKSSFQGKFTVIEMRHIGNLRSSDGAQWSTILNCAVL